MENILILLAVVMIISFLIRGKKGMGCCGGHHPKGNDHKSISDQKTDEKTKSSCH